MGSMNKFDKCPPLWANGPDCQNLHQFPARPQEPGPHRATQSPVTTGSSVIAMKYDGGVVIAADTLGSYGSLARFTEIQRVIKVNETTIVGAGGDFADFQFLSDIIKQKQIDEECADDGFNLKPKALHCWLTRVLYNRRSKFDPLWNALDKKGGKLTFEEAKQTIQQCIRLTYLRDCRAWPNYQIANVHAGGATVEGPLMIDSDWEYAKGVKGYE